MSLAGETMQEPVTNEAERLRISYLHYLYGGGTPLHHVNQFTAAARRLGHEVNVHSMNLLQPDDGESNGSSRSGGLRSTLRRHLSRYLHEPKELLWNFEYIRRQLEIVKDDDPDVLLVRTHQLTCAAGKVRTKTQVPLVAEVNAPADELSLFGNNYFHVPGVARRAEEYLLKRADRIVVVSGPLRDHFVETYGLPTEKIIVNPNGGDTERFRPDIDGSRLRNEYRLGDGLVVGFVGSFHPWHGLDLLEHIVSRLASQKTKFLLVGEGPEWESFRAKIAARPCGEHVVFTGGIPHDAVSEHVAAMDIALVPNLGFYMCPLKLLEYMAAGKAIVAPNRASVAELVKSGEQALLFEPEDPIAATNAIEDLARNADLRRSLGEAARAKVLESLTWQHNAERVIEACRAAITG